MLKIVAPLKWRSDADEEEESDQTEEADDAASGEGPAEEISHDNVIALSRMSPQEVKKFGRQMKAMKKCSVYVPYGVARSQLGQVVPEPPVQVKPEIKNMPDYDPDGTLFTFDFAEGFRSSDFTIMVMEHQEQLTHLFSKDLVAQLATSSLDYYPSTLAAYELLVIDQQVCDKAFFDAALGDMCSRFLSIPNEEIESMLEALGAQYPAALIDHFKLYIDKIREFCQK